MLALLSSSTQGSESTLATGADTLRRLGRAWCPLRNGCRNGISPIFLSPSIWLRLSTKLMIRRPVAFVCHTVHKPLPFPVMGPSVYPGCMRCIRVLVSHRLALYGNLLLITMRISIFFSLGDFFSSVRVVSVAPKARVISVDLVPNQSWVSEVFLPKVAMDWMM